MNLVLIAAAFLILVGLNAFFVFSEFAIVKLRSSQIEEMLEQGTKGAETVRRIHEKLDEYLSVCQVGITFASIALGFVGELVAAKLLIPLFAGIDASAAGGTIAVHVAATSISVVSVSFLHILLGEQVPKLAAIRDARRAALLTAGILRSFHGVFILPLWLLNSSAHAILRLFGIGAPSEREQLSEDELRILLERGQGSGLLSFRRLLCMENIFDLGEMKVRDAMRSRSVAITLSPAMTVGELEAVITTKRFSRFLVVA
ncbi:MAG: CNNM domain-containing protein, partial [Spirochaetota bacterium]